MAQRLVAPLPLASERNTSPQVRQSQPLKQPQPLSRSKAPQPTEQPRESTENTGLSKLPPIVDKKPTRILDFDVETVAAGFADPQWVPQKVTCVAWSWIGEDKTESRICTPLGLFGKPELRREMLADLLDAMRKAEMVTGHNIERFDLPVINAECMRLKLEPIREILVQDTMRLYRSTGFKKGLDNLEAMFKTQQKKMSLNWQEWQDAYDEDGWGDIRRRCESDVIGHKEVRRQLLDARFMRSPRFWRGM